MEEVGEEGVSFYASHLTAKKLVKINKTYNPLPSGCQNQTSCLSSKTRIGEFRFSKLSMLSAGTAFFFLILAVVYQQKMCGTYCGKT